MSTDSTIMSNNKPIIKAIELHKLQPILSRTFDDRLIVVRYTAKNMMQPGENYGSTILSVHAVIKRDDNAQEEDLYLVAKMPPPTEYQRKIFDSPYTFKKEIFMYEDIVPYYRELEREAGLKENELFDILPKYYQSRLSLNPDIEFDDNAVILMENLKMRGYYTCNRAIGCDHEHAKVAIRAMARFHALGMTAKYKRPEHFEILKQRSKCVEYDHKDFERMIDEMMKRIEKDPEIGVYINRCKTAVMDSLTNGLWTAVPSEPWSTIIHADFWVNNILFHRDGDGRVDDVKFVDFQNYLFFSPLRELVFYIFSSTEVRDDYIEELTDLYYETFLAVLKRMDCDTELFTRQKFSVNILADAKYEFMHLCFMLKILTMDVQETKFDYDKMENMLEVYQGNEMFIQRMRKVVSYFVKNNWI
ncbi:uncharacterized protein LOC109851991 [Pseudomyrmex gracilis]|uniref:uncharacterized protein LOC109851991 n=1 Tax=Pseudomyrmex gracilis TaxID=219809 RepID=UPI0009948F2F|nr:uncharacterized protein LOC109851991 [Pseudomyrmex gracilis]